MWGALRIFVSIIPVLQLLPKRKMLSISLTMDAWRRFAVTARPLHLPINLHQRLSNMRVTTIQTIQHRMRR